MLGQGQEILGSVGENAKTIQAEKAAPQEQAQDRANAAMAPGQDQAKAQATAQGTAAGNAVTITPQLAEGLVKATGDESWRRAMGTKMDPSIYSSLLTMGVRKSYEDQIISNKELLEKLKEAAEQKKTETEVSGKKDVANIGANAKVKTAEISKEKASAKEESPESKKEKASKLLDTISKTKDPQAKQSLVANYNGLAKDLGLQPYEEGSVDKLKDALGGLISKAADKISSLGSGEDPKHAAAVKWLKDNKAPVTEANIKHVMENQ